MKKIKSICSIILIIAFLCPSGAFASAIAQHELHENVDQVMQYMTVLEDGQVIFNDELARENNEPDNIIQIGIEAERIAEAYYLYDNQNPNSRVDGLPTFPVHGNWCGPSYGSGTPIDDLDAACQWHDFCYQDFGDFNCICDQGLIDRIDQIYDSLSPHLKNKATAIVTAFTAVMLANGC